MSNKISMPQLDIRRAQFTAVVRSYSSIVACTRSLRKSVSGSRGIADSRLQIMEGRYVVRELREAPEDEKRRVVASIR